jgi:hypothetical protein
MKIAITAVLAAVLAGALGFFGGVTYQKAQTPSFAGRTGDGNFTPPAGFTPGQGGANRQGGAGRFAGGIATGTVLAADSKSITVKVESGGSKTVYISSTTNFGKQEALTAADIKVGDNVMAVGQASSGGITARSVQVVPPGTDFRPGFGF